MTAEPDWKNQIKQILSQTGNDKCADCKDPEPDWAVHNVGVFVCIKCSGVHRQLGVHISKVKSTEYDKWTVEQLQYVRQRGNTAMNQLLESRLPCFVIRPSDTPFDEIRRIFIQNKYGNKLYYPQKHQNIQNVNNNQNVNDDDSEVKRSDTNLNSDDLACFEMPMKVVIKSFCQEFKKTKVYFQLLHKYLYFFRQAHDSYDYEHYDVSKLESSIVKGGSNQNDPILQIKITTNNQVIRVRSFFSLVKNANSQTKCDDLVNFCQLLRRATAYYNSDTGKEQKIDHEPSNPKNQFTVKDLNEARCTILGIAQKKGGGARNWRKRWWILDAGILYYFKDDFRSNKKAKGIGTPQGNIPLFQADVTWDDGKKRTNKNNALLICTHKRTYYIQPTNNNAKQFYDAVDTSCDHMWNRQTVDFSNLK